MTNTDSLKTQALKAMKNAYAPYSKFKVGAAISDENGKIYVGCNVENSAYPEGVCAEASAISSMIVSGANKIKKILIVSSGDKMVTPCGGCRQKIREFSNKDTEILIAHNDKISKFSIEDLLPHSFSKNHLK